MAVAIDNTGASVGDVSLATKTLASFAVGAGANRLLFVGVSQFANTDRVPGATFNGSALSVWDAATVAEGGGTRRVTLLYLVAPANATTGIIVTWAGTVDEFVIGATSWTGVDQTTPLGTAVKNTSTGGTSTSSVTVSNASGDAVHDTLSSDADAAPEVTANQTQRWRAIAAASTSEGAGQSATGAGSNITMTWTNIHGGNTSNVLAHIGVAIKQVSAGGTRGLFRTPSMSGLGGGGSFFRDPLAAPMQMIRRDRIFVPDWIGDAA